MRKNATEALKPAWTARTQTQEPSKEELRPVGLLVTLEEGLQLPPHHVKDKEGDAKPETRNA